MELSKEMLQGIPLAKLRVTYEVLAKELPEMVYASFKNLLVQLEKIIGNNALVTAHTLIDGEGELTIEASTLKGTPEEFIDWVKIAYEQEGFHIVYAITRNSAKNFDTYKITISYLPQVLDWLKIEKRVPLRTVVRKLLAN